MRHHEAINNLQDVIDSRDVMDRIAYLEGLGDEVDAVEHEELQALQKLQEEAESSPDWGYGETLIRDTYFRDYAEELARDIGALDVEGADQWPLRHIDWDEAARELKHDYFCVDFDGVEYWIRA